MSRTGIMNPKSLNNLQKAFSKDNQPKKHGRKPSQLKKFIKDNNVSDYDITNMIKNILCKNTLQLSDFIDSDKCPIIIKIFAMALIKDLSHGHTETVMIMINRAFGGVKEIKEINSKISLLSMNVNAAADMTEKESEELFFNTMKQVQEEGE